MRASHGFLAGMVGGLTLAAHAFVLFGAGVAAGAGLVLAWGALAGVARWARRRLAS